MVLDRTRSYMNRFDLDHQQLEEVKEFVYLGTMTKSEANTMQEVIRITIQTMEDLNVRIARSTTFAMASYGCESWTISKKVEKKVDAFEMWTY